MKQEENKPKKKQSLLDKRRELTIRLMNAYVKHRKIKEEGRRKREQEKDEGTATP